MGSTIAISLLLVTSPMTETYREAALKWRAVAELRREKIQAYKMTLEVCEETNAKLSERTAPVVEVVPAWVWPVVAATVVVSFSAGVVIAERF